MYSYLIGSLFVIGALGCAGMVWALLCASMREVENYALALVPVVILLGLSVLA